jgi:hypothetical protein
MRCNAELDDIKRQTEEGGDWKILTFISDVVFHSGEAGYETIRQLFAAGYCYYFALMLESAFPGGVVCLCWPYGHVVWVKDGLVYDVDGLSSAEYDLLIPVSELGEALDDFRHVEGLGFCATAEDVQEIGERCKREGKFVVALNREELAKERAGSMRIF